MRNGLRLLLARQPYLQAVGEAADLRQAVALSESANPDMVVIDDESYVIRALKAGARAHLLKDSAEARLLAAARAISKILVEDYMRQL
jgi:DNA-binding NarL/FixJ family response regulator